MNALRWPAYLVALLLIGFPLLDAALSIWPPRAGEVVWRFGALGLFSRTLLTPLLGVLLAFAVALLLRHRWMLRLLTLLTGMATLVLLGVVGLFVLDAVQTRAQVSPEARVAFDTASLVAFGKYVLGIVVSLAFFVSGLGALRQIRREDGAGSGAATARERSTLLVSSPQTQTR